MNTQQKYERVLISAKEGMGGYLAAPGYPTHTHCVFTDLSKKPENRSCMSLDYALTVDYVSPKDKKSIRLLIKNWEDCKPPIGSSAFNTWVEACVTHWGSFQNALSHIHKFYPSFNQ